MPWLMVIGVQEQGSGLCVRNEDIVRSGMRDVVRSGMRDVVRLQSRAPDDGHISTRNMLSRL